MSQMMNKNILNKTKKYFYHLFNNSKPRWPLLKIVNETELMTKQEQDLISIILIKIESMNLHEQNGTKNDIISIE